jgi:hypothetical protein
VSGCFLDTTIVVDFAHNNQPQTAKALAHTKINEPIAVAEYAYRELLVGRVGLLCDAHNAVVASTNVVEVALSLSVRGAFARTPRAQEQEILKLLKVMFQKKSVDPAQARRDIAESLMIQANKVWRRGSRYPAATRVQSLACFNNGRLTLDQNGLLQGPNNSFNCAAKTVCAAAQYMYNDRAAIRKMIAALDSPKLPANLKNKGETKSRRKALDLLERRGPAKISKADCRRLGDAYFAQMCPKGAHVLTSNLDDFKPLCDALGGSVRVP